MSLNTKQNKTLFKANDWLLATVVHVTDGDTVTVKNIRSKDGKPLKANIRPEQSLKLRLQDIDAPEICQAFGSQSKRYLAQKINGKTVLIQVKYPDTYDRWLATLWWQDENINASMVREGMAWGLTMRKHFGQLELAKSGAYATEQAQAEKNKRGLFALANSEHPRSFRDKNGSCYAP